MKPLSLRLNETIVKFARMVEAVVSLDTWLVLYLDPSLDTIDADPIGVERILVNLVRSSRHALPGGGEITLETASVALAKALCRGDRQVPPGTYAQITSRTRGPLPAARAFRQAAETELWICLEIARAHGGEVLVDVEDEAGTRVDVYLPLRHPTTVEPRRAEPVQRRQPLAAN